MTYLLSQYPELAWAFVLLLAWFAGEYIQRWMDVPRICIYGLVGFLLAAPQAGILPSVAPGNLLLLANMAFGLILFEVGYRINLHWLRANRWLLASSVLEAGLTFLAVYSVLVWKQVEGTTAILLSTLAMSTSPAAIIRVINEQRSSGQVTERAIHLSALNCVMAVFVFKMMVGYQIFQTSGNVGQAFYGSLLVFVMSAVLGTICGVLMPALLRQLGRFAQDGTLAFAMSVMMLVALAHALKWSPIVATLVFGMTARHRRITLSQTQRNFGVLGDLLSVFLFVFVSSTLVWTDVRLGLELALLIILVRTLTKMAGISLLAYWSGMSLKKGLLTGLALSPISVFVILTLEQTRYLGVNLMDSLAPLVAVTLILELLGPVFTRAALVWAKETPRTKEI